MSEKNLIEKHISEWFNKKRPEAHIRSELDWSYTFENFTFILSEVRPAFQNPSKLITSPFVKVKYIKARGIWKIYWMRSDLKWYAYDPAHEVNSIFDAFTEIEKDEFGCFFG